MMQSFFTAATAATATKMGASKKLPRTAISSLKRKRKAGKARINARRGRRRFEGVFGEMGFWVFFWDSSSTDERLWMEDRMVGERSRDDGVLVSFVWFLTSIVEFSCVFLYWVSLHREILLRRQNKER